MKQYGDVFQLGIRVPMDWWEKVKPVCPPPLYVNHDHPCGQVNLTIAYLPLAEFSVYWNEIEYEPKTYDKVRAAVTDARKKHGWEEVERNEDDYHSRWEPTQIGHRYFDVDHHSV